MRGLFITIIVLVFIINAKSQYITRNNIYFELGGAAMLYSLNYERLLSSNNNINFPLRIGVSYARSNVYGGDNTLGLPLSLSFIKNINGKVYFETRAFATTFIYSDKNYGMGGSVLISKKNIVKVMPGVSIGFRRQPQAESIYYHIHFQVSYYRTEPDGTSINPWISFGLGYALR